MIEVSEATSLIGKQVHERESTLTPLTAADGLILAEPIVSPIDTPPFDKSLMDGYAVRSVDISAKDTRLRVVGAGMAGELPPQPLSPQSAMLVMTGAVLPHGSDAVVVRELTTTEEDHTGVSVVIQQFPVTAEQNLMRQGQICASGSEVLDRGHLVGAAEIGVLAEVGQARVAVIPPARVAVLATGNELVAVDQPLNPGQIRNSNGPLLCSMAAAVGCLVTDLGIGPDHRDQLGRLIAEGLTHDVLVLSGGVSAGDLDLVPELLKAAGVREIFHQVRLKPGKPLWFGVGPSGTLVFGLPGNPVSSLVCFQLFVRPALLQMAGHKVPTTTRRTAVLANRYTQRGDRPTYFPSQVSRLDDGGRSLRVLPWLGSSDLHTFTQANCLAIFPAGETLFEPGQAVQFLELRSPV